MSFLHLIYFVLKTGHRYFANIAGRMFIPIGSGACCVLSVTVIDYLKIII